MGRAVSRIHTLELVRRKIPGLHIICDICLAEEWFSASEGLPDLDTQAKLHGWTRFGPSGSDLCHKCHGGSPNSIVQVHAPTSTADPGAGASPPAPSQPGGTDFDTSLLRGKVSPGVPRGIWGQGNKEDPGTPGDN